MGKQEELNEIVIYDAPGRKIEVQVHTESLWLSLTQVAVVFGVNKPAISKHLKNIYASGELDKQATVSKMETVQTEGGRTVRRQVEMYNLDAVISVGYRVNSALATRFRIWATGVLREHLTRGLTINRQRLEENAREIEAALELVRRTVASPQLTTDMGRGLVEVIARYTQTFLWLQRYDEGLLTEPKGEPGGVLLTFDEARAAIARLKDDLMARREAGSLFGQERGDGLSAILGILQQSVSGQPAYPSIESKAAHLLYFIIKDHPFTDGNKRIGAMLFVDFLNRNGRLFLPSGEAIINDIGLAALALLTAESNPRDKDLMIRLTINMLTGEH
ncbi:MAG: virulence protein RhuM/Fic/DOC family protein [Pseudomonadota bacterium]|nr:virulence RhuM family protein [Pseudomonadota bacterium]